MRTGTCQHLHVFIIIYIHVVIFCRLLFFINQQSFGGNRMLVKYDHLSKTMLSTFIWFSYFMNVFYLKKIQSMVSNDDHDANSLESASVQTMKKILEALV